MGGRGSQGGRLKSSLRGSAPSPVRGGGCRLVLARLGLEGSAGARLLRFTPVERAKIGSGREFRPDGKHLPPAHGFSTLSLALRRDQGQHPQTRFTALLERSP